MLYKVNKHLRFWNFGIKMSSEKFEDLEEELKVLYEDIRTKINTKIPKLTGGNPNWIVLYTIDFYFVCVLRFVLFSRAKKKYYQRCRQENWRCESHCKYSCGRFTSILSLELGTNNILSTGTRWKKLHWIVWRFCSQMFLLGRSYIYACSLIACYAIGLIGFE